MYTLFINGMPKLEFDDAVIGCTTLFRFSVDMPTVRLELISNECGDVVCTNILTTFSTDGED